MELTASRTNDGIELRVSGRLDGFWAARLAAELDTRIREGVRELRLNLCEVSYLSSAGIGVLVKYHQQLLRRGGGLVISLASPAARKVLEMARLGDLIAADAAPLRMAPDPPGAGFVEAVVSPSIEVHPLNPGAALKVRLIGDPDVLRGCLFNERHAQSLRFPADRFGVGIGAFGRSFEDCRDRLGDFVALAGSAAYMPADGSNIPDFLTGGEPDLVVVFSLYCDGSFAYLVRFEGVAMPGLLQKCLDLTKSDLAGLAIVAESLRPSPAVTLAAGLVARRPSGPLAGALSRLENALHARLHAARFPHRTLHKGSSDLPGVVADLFHGHTLREVRSSVGASEEYVRGCCWLGPARLAAG